MKKLLLIAAATLISVGAFAQGKLQFSINSDNLIYITTDVTRMAAGDATKTADWGLGGGPVALPGSSLYAGAGSTAAALGGSWVVTLFGGTSAGSMTLQTTANLADISSANFGGIDGFIDTTLNGLPAGTPAFFQVDVSNGTYDGKSIVFQATPQEAVFSSIFYMAPSPVNSTWTPGTFEMTDYVANLGAGSGYFGGIAVAAAVPEPGTFALAGLGLAAMLVLRRRS